MLSVILLSITPSFAEENYISDDEEIIISQGDWVNMKHENGSFFCSVGYVDKEKNTILFAGHCVKGLEKGESIYASDMVTEIGVLKDSSYSKITRPYSDYAVVELTNSKPGNNIFTGDKWTSPHQVSIGDELCSYGNSSKQIHCGKVLSVNHNVIIGDKNSGGIRGDSGGPAWIPNKGFVGVFSVFTDNSSGFTYPKLMFHKDSMIGAPMGVYEYLEASGDRVSILRKMSYFSVDAKEAFLKLFSK